MDVGEGSVARYTECLQWMLAPTDLNGLNPDPTRAPDVINNSWECVDSEGCTDPLVLQTVIANVRSAGIAVVAAAGNSGPGCASMQPPAIYEEAFTVGATDSLDASPLFSSRGPAVLSEVEILKPNISAPGLDLTVPALGTYFTGQGGTSYAAPHVAGTIALLISANPALAGDVDGLEAILEQTAVPLTTVDGCGGLLPDAVPNNTFGWGRLDAKAAYDQATATTGITSIESRDTFLLTMHPNPTRRDVEILYATPRTSPVSLTIYDVRGRFVRSIVRHQQGGGGPRSLSWDGRAENGSVVPRGVYFVHLEVESQTISRKLVVLF
jgi:subtilisin family serine protease